MNRRTALVALGGALASACAARGNGSEPPDFTAGRLRRYRSNPASTLPAGMHPLGLGDARDGVLYVPPHAPGARLPLLLLLHGATGRGRRIATRFQPYADARGVLLLAPDSRSRVTWEALTGAEFGEDVAFIDRALAHAHAHCRVDTKRLGSAGFSDGASYAISMAYINGDVFGIGAGFAPGSLLGRQTHGRARFFITHGTRDEILHIQATSRRIVPFLQGRGYDVQYTEHEGGHVLVPAHLERMFDWWLQG